MDDPQDHVAAAKHRIALEFVRRNIPIGDWLYDSGTGIWTLSYGKLDRAVFTVFEQEMLNIAGSDEHRFRELSSRTRTIADSLDCGVSAPLA